MSEEMDDAAPLFCERNGAYCVRAFCEDYGCADAAGVPVDANDIAAGTVDPDEMILPLPAALQPEGEGR